MPSAADLGLLLVPRLALRPSLSSRIRLLSSWEAFSEALKPIPPRRRAGEELGRAPRLHAAGPGPALLGEGVGCWVQNRWKQEPRSATGTQHPRRCRPLPHPAWMRGAGDTRPRWHAREKTPKCLQDQAHHSCREPIHTW